MKRELKIKEFFLNEFHSEQELIKNLSLSELIIHEQGGKLMLKELENIIKYNQFLEINRSEEEIYFDKNCLTDNLSTVIQCIAVHYGQIIVCHVDMNDKFIELKTYKN